MDFRFKAKGLPHHSAGARLMNAVQTGQVARPDPDRLALVPHPCRVRCGGISAVLGSPISPSTSARFPDAGNGLLFDAIDSLADLDRLSLGLLESLLPTRKDTRCIDFVLDAGTAMGRRQLSLVH
jgi:hypothetical protein